MTESHPLEVGVIGLGGLGAKHAENVVRSDHRLVGGVDVSPKARTGFEADHSVPTYEQFDELLDRGVDAVIVTTPNRFHERYAVKALEAGVGVLCEKPLAHTLDSAERIRDAAVESTAPLMVGFNNRFSPTVEHVRDAIDEGRLGEVVHVEANWVRRRGIPGRGGWFTRKELSGGGALIDIGVHALDLALYLLDHPDVVEVTSVTRSQFGHREDYAYEEMYGPDNGPDGFDVEDSAIAFIRCADGQTISLEAAWATNRPDNDEVILRGTDAGARFTLSGSTVEFYEAEHGAEEPLPTPNETTSGRDMYEAELDHFLSAVATGETPGQNTVEEAFAVQRVIDAIYESDQVGESIQF